MLKKLQHMQLSDVHQRFEQFACVFLQGALVELKQFYKIEKKEKLEFFL